MIKCIVCSIRLLLFELYLWFLTEILNIYIALRIKFKCNFSGKSILKLSNYITDKSQKCDRLSLKTEKLILFYVNK